MSEINHKPLETEFKKNTYRFRLIRREGDLAIFHKVALKGAMRPKDVDAGFEVVVISRHNGYELGGVKIEPAETYPSSEQWGSKGWTCTTLLRAEQKLDELKGIVVNCINGTSELENETDEPEVAVEEPETETVKPARRPRGSGLPIITIPEGEFSIKEAATLNPNVNPATVYLCIKEAEGKKLIETTRTERRAERGKPTQLYRKIAA
jgi:hypothetical protein